MHIVIRAENRVGVERGVDLDTPFDRHIGLKLEFVAERYPADPSQFLIQLSILITVPERVGVV